MKFLSVFALLAVLATPASHAASLKEIFQQIADTTETGNGNGHSVTQLEGRYNERAEIAKMKREVNKGYHGKKEDCRYDVYADIDGALKEMRDQWSSEKSASRIKGLAEKGAIKQIIYSVWDSSTGDSEYCSISAMNVYGADGTVLVFDFNETD